MAKNMALFYNFNTFINVARWAVVDYRMNIDAELYYNSQ